MELLSATVFIQNNFIIFVDFFFLFFSKFYLSESKVLQYFGNMRLNSAAMYAFAEVLKGMNHTGL